MEYDRGAARRSEGESLSELAVARPVAGGTSTGLAARLRLQIRASRKLRVARKPAKHCWTELMRLPSPSLNSLTEYFDLTPAEARLAQIMAQGSSLGEAAQVLDIRMSTARS